MAIDARISLAPAPTVNVGQRFNQALNNLQNIDLLNQRRDLAPIQLEQAQRANELGIAQQPALLQQAEFASSDFGQELLSQQQIQQFDIGNAQSLNKAFASGNKEMVYQELERQNKIVSGLVQSGQLPKSELIEIQQAQQMAQTPKGLAQIQQMTTSFLAPKGTGAGTQSNFAPQISPVQTDIETGQKYVIKTDRNTGQSGRIDVKDAKGRTPEQEEQAAIRTSLLNDAAEVSKASFDQLKGVRSSISTIDEAILAIEKDATSGFFAKYFPSFKESTIALENTAQRMGLDVISATTFGALSEGELKLAMDTAMPRNLKPKALKKWLTERKNAKVKLARELSKMAITLGKGKVTIAEHLEDNATFDERSDEDILSEYGL